MPYLIDNALQIIFSWEYFLCGHSLKEQKIDGYGWFMLLSLKCIGILDKQQKLEPFACAFACGDAPGVGQADRQVSRTRWEWGRMGIPHIRLL